MVVPAFLDKESQVVAKRHTHGVGLPDNMRVGKGCEASQCEQG
jgi:hypothetical protein